ncbi:MAG: hypothetical protein M1817_001766 [Caeruleum heppii]|nr:MAG: hypothetical protein M1817_001766 [Caeruleum heppii]
MGRKGQPPPINLAGPALRENSPRSPLSPLSPRTTGRTALSPTLLTSDKPSDKADPSTSFFFESAVSSPTSHGPNGMNRSPTIASFPTRADTFERSRAGSDGSKPFFSNHKASKSSSRLQPIEATIRQVSDSDLSRSDETEESTLFPLRKVPSSTPDLSKLNLAEETEHSSIPSQSSSTGVGLAGASAGKGHSREPTSIPRRPVPLPSTSEGAVPSNQPFPTGARKNRPRPFAHLLTRTRSIRTDTGPPSHRTPTHSRLATSENSSRNGSLSVEQNHGMKTAPLQTDREGSFRDMMNSTLRNRSADRHFKAGSEDGSIKSGRDTAKHQGSFTSSFREGTGAHLLSSLKSSSTKAADGIGKAGKGIFGKLTRSGSSGETAVTDENYVCTVISLPLVDQTRHTRISKRLEHSKDKTEFWMPALPWRCIDYLNSRGCEEEGLYRIPGSGPRVKEWQRRFDTELDIDLFEEPDLYDINIIGSMFKAWLRELPDEILPKPVQDRVADKCMGATEVPQMLKDELSRLPPYNYYLLFAITCHLSLLHSYLDKNKMDYRNLCICFQPCLKIDSFCFQFLVCDWKNCWQGCWTEKEALAEEYCLLEGTSPATEGSVESIHEVIEERAVSSSESSKPPSARKSTPEKKKPPPLKDLDTSRRDASPSKAVEQRSPRTAEAGSQQLPPLSPMVPLSPLRI